MDRKRSNHLIIASDYSLMPSLTRTIETDVCVVGAGFVGLAHALEARRRGLSAVLLERGARATGASVRDTGHLLFSALPAGEPLEAAVTARERWLDLAQDAGIAVEAGGTLIVAHEHDELALMEAAAADPKRGARMRSAKKVGRLAPIPVEGVLGGFHAKHDLRIDPRSAPAALARLLARDPSARIEWRTNVDEIEPGIVHAGALRVRAQAIVVCAGAHGRTTLPPALWPHEHGVSLRETQMLRLAPPTGRRYRQTLMTGASLLELPAFWAGDGIEPLRNRLEIEQPEMIERGTIIEITQQHNGGLVLSSTSTYTHAPKLYSRERGDTLALEQASALLGVAPHVRQRWRSVSVAHEMSPADFLVTRPMPTVRVVHALRSTAIASCHQRAQTVLEDALSEPVPSSAYIRVQDLRASRGPGSGGVRDHPSAFGARLPRG